VVLRHHVREPYRIGCSLKSGTPRPSFPCRMLTAGMGRCGHRLHTVRQGIGVSIVLARHPRPASASRKPCRRYAVMSVTAERSAGLPSSRKSTDRNSMRGRWHFGVLRLDYAHHLPSRGKKRFPRRCLPSRSFVTIITRPTLSAGGSPRIGARLPDVCASAHRRAAPAQTGSPSRRAPRQVRYHGP